MEKYNKILKKGNLLIIGGTELERAKFITKLISITGYETYRFPKRMKIFSDYFDYVQKMKIYNPLSSYVKKKWFWEAHLDWVFRPNTLLVLEEIQDMEERWKHEIIRYCLKETEYRKKGEETVHLIISQELEDNLIEKISEQDWLEDKDKNERRTRIQIIEQNIKVIDISDLKRGKNYQ